MKLLTDAQHPGAAGTTPERHHDQGATTAAELPVWRISLLRFGYAFVAGGILAAQWPTLLHHDPTWPLMTGVKTSMLAATSVLALLGLRYPLQMLPVLLFEITWKLIWFAAVAWPLWAAGRLDPAAQKVASDCLWVVIVLAVIPWHYVLRQYVTKRGYRWRSR